jgi:hypothetical protein
MPDEMPPTSPGTAPPSAPAPPSQYSFRIGDEFGTAEKNLPPTRIILIGVGIILLVVVILAIVEWPRTPAAGAIDQIVPVEIPDQGSMMVAINVSFENGGKKPFWIHTIHAELDTGDKTYTDDAASPADFDRYYQAFPALKQYAIPALQTEARINPGGQIAGTVIVSFPVTPQAFASRKALKVIIQPYDQPVPLVLTK